MTPEEREARTAARMEHLKQILSPEEWAQVVGGGRSGQEVEELGPVNVIGPECFASADDSVICWQGVNYYREPDENELAKVFVVMDDTKPVEVQGKLRRIESLGTIRDMAERANRHGYDLDPDDVLAALDASPAEVEEPDHPDTVKVRRVIHQCHADVDYYGQSDDPMAMGRVMGVREVLHVLGEGDKADPFDTPDPACTTCGQPMDDPQWCSRNPATGKGGHTHGGGVAAR